MFKPLINTNFKNNIVLVIDDVPTNLGVIDNYLESYGLEVLVDQRGESGLKKAQLLKPDLILLDIMLPDIDGFEVCRRLKADKDTKDIPIIFMTALTGEDQKITGFEVGAVDYITKPFKQKEVVARVITHLSLRHLQKELQEKNASLQQEINYRKEKEREMETLFAQLLRQEKLATVGKISANIAHELRNPLGVVKQSIYYLKRLHQRQELTYSNPKVQKHLDAMEIEVDISGQVISNLLNLTRTNAHSPQQVDLHLMVLDVINRCRLPKNIELITDLEVNPFLVWADSVQLRQILINLLNNAIEATWQGGTITIQAKQLTDKQESMINIIDTGIGMNVETCKNIFEPLFTTKSSGTGLGLSICKQIIEAHNGKIDIISQPNKGTTVTIILPLLSSSSKASSNKESSS